MSLRAWCFAVAVGLTASLGQAQEAGDSAEGQANQQQEQPQSPQAAPTIPQPVSVEIVESQTAADAREGSEAEARQREIDDLVAQQGMNAATQAINEATQRMASDSREMTVATWVGVGLLTLTLLLTLQANFAARKAVKVMDKMGRDQSRAYVDVDAISFRWGGKNRDNPNFTITVRNSGATPAKWYQIRSDYSFFEHGAEVPKVFSELPLTGEFSGKWSGISGGNSCLTVRGPQIRNAKEFEKCLLVRSPIVNDGALPTHNVGVFGEIRYCTAFDEIFVSQFLFGANFLQPYDGKIVRETSGEATDGKAVEWEEAPKELSRWPIELAIYEEEQQG